MRKYSKSKKIRWTGAPDIKKRVSSFVDDLGISWVKKSRIICYRSENANTRACARIWGLSRIWQMALKTPPAYVIEVISEKFDRLSKVEQDKVLLHELTHIPMNFSGSLIPHIRKGKRNFHRKVDELIGRYFTNIKIKTKTEK